MFASQGADLIFFNNNNKNACFRVCKAGWVLLCFQTGEQVTRKKSILFGPVTNLFPCNDTFLFLLAGHKWILLRHAGQKNPFSDPQVEKKS